MAQAGRLPAFYVCHGGGPMPLMPPPPGGPAGMFSDSTLSSHLRSLADHLPSPPKAILVISAHWEERELRVSSSEHPSMLYDYGGFPAETFKYKYDAPGKPELAARVCALLGASGHTCKPDPTRGYDHGVFVPLMLAFPHAEVPIVCLSLHASLDPATHLSMGRALRPLRDEGVLLLGSGSSYHNMGGFDMQGRRSGPPVARAWDEALAAAVASDRAVRDESLAGWERLPEARAAHPREEHLLPLHVVAGAAGDDPGARLWGDSLMGVASSSFRFDSRV